VTAAAVRHALWRGVFATTGGLVIDGRLPDGGCVVVANHCSHADAPSLLAALDPGHRPVVAAAADHWFERPTRALVARTLVGAVPVERTGGGYAQLQAQRAALSAGRAVVVFPSGSRRASDGRFHSGAFRLAAEAGVPVVPVRISGTDVVLPMSGRPHRGQIRVAVGEPMRVVEPAGAAEDAATSLGRAMEPADRARPGLRDQLARVAGSPLGVLLAFAWAVAEATVWPVVTELLLAAMLLSGPRRPVRSALGLAAAATLGSAAGGVVTLLLARHGVLLPQPLTGAPMRAAAAQALDRSEASGLWTQPVSGIPYKVYSRLAGTRGIGAGTWFALSLLVRSVRLALVAAGAVAVARITRRWLHLYTRALAAGLLTFVLALCAVVSGWSGR
jgi:1-acyl-sn-glycerol-3-phosphate acyltransferase